VHITNGIPQDNNKVFDLKKMSKVSKKKRVGHKHAASDKAHSANESNAQALIAPSLIPILIILIFSFLVYFSAIFNDFVYDDNLQIVDNTWFRDIRNIPTIFSTNFWSFFQTGTISNYYRPLIYVIYMFNYHLFGLKPWGFHLVNILFHCGVSILVFIITRRFLTENKVSTSPSHFSPAFIAAMLFASHPIHTEAVTWISAMPDVAFTFFYLLSFYLYINSKTRLSGSYLFSIVCFAVAAFLKEPALTLPLILLAHDYAFRQPRTHFLDYAKRYVPYLLIGVGYLALRIQALGKFAPTKSHEYLSAYQYVINVFPLFTQYLEKLIAPFNLNAFYVFHPIASLLELKGALSFMTVPLLPVLYISALAQNTFTERYLYLPSVGYVFLLAVFFSWVRDKLPGAVRSMTIIIIAILGLYTIGTVLRNNVWKNDVNLWSDTVKKSPDSALVHINFGAAYGSKGQFDMAISGYQTALRLNPNDARAYHGLGLAYASTGQFDMAISEYQTALRLNPNDARAHNALGNTYISKGQFDMAISEYKTALRLNPNNAGTHYNLAVVYLKKGDLDMARKEVNLALNIRPDYHEARQLLDDIIKRRHYIE